MTCTSCGRANRAGARFCGGCGGALAPRCPACGAESEPGAQFCDACGAGLAAAHSAETVAARKVVSIVFADLIGSTALHERLDPESVSRLMERYHRAVRATVEAHGGTVASLLGDGVMCAFGVPRVAEDDAIRAVRAAVAVQNAFREFAREERELAGELGLRVAVNTGEVVVSDEHAAGIGDPLNVAARLQQEARDGEVLIGEETQRVVGGLVTLERVGRFALKGRAEPVAAFRVVSLERPAGAAAVAFVGRDAELRRLGAVYDAAVAAPAARLAVVLGSPGLGKSRLLAELARRLAGRATLLVAQCNAAGGATFAPLAEALRAHFGLPAGASGDALRAAIDAVVPGEDAERGRIAAGIGALIAGTPAAPEETFFVVRRLLAALAAARPLVLEIDDLQWAEPLLLDLTEHLVQWGSGVPLLVLAAARPELRAARSSLTSAGGVVADVVTLAGLDAAAATRLAAEVIGADALPAAVAGRVLAASEGNPLFLGELVRMLVNDGALKREGESWTAAAELAQLEMPPTIQALLAARIERLRPEERLLLERAAVIGRQFSRSAVAHLLPRDAQADLDARLESLRRSELIEPDTGWLLGEPALRFHHVLIRDAAYRRLLRNTRAELHARFADWLVARAGESVEHDETIGWHLEQAHQHLRELGPLDADGRALGERAARYLAAAGRRALARDDLPPAGSLLGRALDRLDPADPARADLALDWCEALLAAGDVAPAARALAELERLAAGSERLRAWHICFSGQLAVLSDPQALRASAEAVAAAAATLTGAGDVAGEAKAHAVHAQVLAQLGMIGACEAALDRALAAARRAGDRRRANAVLAGAPVAALWGPSPVTRASGRCLDVVRVLRITQGAPAVEAVALRCQAVLETLRGRADAARRMIASSRQMVEELGITQRVLEADLFAGLIELLEGDAVAAERCLRAAWDGLREQGLGIDAAQAAALLGRALLAQGRGAEAEALSRQSEALAGDSFKAGIAWRGLRAEALAARGEHAAAVEVARAAVDIAAATDDLLDHADARASLAVALRAASRGAEADAEQARAIELWEAKGATLLAERARRAAAPTDRVAAPAARVAPPPVRRVRENAATASGKRMRAAALARDLETIAALCADDIQVHHHPTGALIEREAGLNRFRLLCRAEGLAFQWQSLATLGDSLELGHDVTSFERLTQDELSFGASRSSYFNVIDVNARGQCRRVEVFADDRLGDAVARLYARYAELLPEGPERGRAAAITRSVATMMTAPDRSDRHASALSPAVELRDQRTLGTGSARGPEAVLRTFHSLLDVSAEVAVQVDDVLDLSANGYLVRWTTSGTDRTTGGAFERQFLMLCVFGDGGLLSDCENFDSDREAEALARFDALTAERTPPARRVQSNAASAARERVEAAFAARDLDAITALYADVVVHVDHPTGARYGREGVLGSLKVLLRKTRDPSLRDELLATLGDSLALVHRRASAKGGGDERFDAGEFDENEVVLCEVDESGRFSHIDVFAEDHLGDAIVRLYERHAELLPAGVERERGAATARSIAKLRGTGDRWPAQGAPFDPEIEARDHRTVGFGTLRGADAVLRAVGSLRQLSADLFDRFDDVLALRSDALLVRATGTVRASGGAFEQDFCQVFVFGADGLVTRWEQFDADQAAEALARFDGLAPGQPPAGNAAWRALARFERAWAARDWDGVLASYAPAHRMDDRRKLMRMQVAGEQFLANERLLFELPGSGWQSELVATRGERLALCRVRFDAGGEDGGPMTVENLDLVEVDAGGLRSELVVFDPEDSVAAFAELERRAAAGGRAARPVPRRVRENAATANSARMTAAMAARDADALADLLADDLEAHHHPMATSFDREGAIASLAGLFSARELAFRHEALATLGDRLGLFRASTAFSELAGERIAFGATERESLMLMEVDAHGRQRRLEFFAPERLGDAVVRLYERHSELLPDGPERTRSAATARSIAARTADLPALAATFAPDVEAVDHRVLGTWSARGVEALREQFRSIVDLTDDLALRFDDVLGLRRDAHLVRVTNSGRLRAGGGPYERSFLMLRQTNADGLFRRVEWFDPEREADALARFDALAAATPPPSVRFENAATRAVARFEAALEARDWQTISADAAPEFRQIDRRGSVQLDLDRDQHLEWLRVGLERPSWRSESQVLATRGDRLALGRVRSLESDQSVGPSENEWLAIVELNERGERSAIVMLDPGDLDAAHAELDARFSAGEGAPYSELLASLPELLRAVGAPDPGALARLLPADFALQSHRRFGSRERFDRDGYAAVVATARELAMRGPLRLEHLRLSASAALAALNWRGTREGGDFEQSFALACRHDGRSVHAMDLYDAEQLDDALTRYEELAATPPAARIENAATRHMERYARCWRERNWDGVLACLAPTHRAEDRRAGVRSSLDAGQHVASMRLVFENASVDWQSDLLATRGERLALFRTRLAGEHEGAGFALDYLQVDEVDASGRRAAQVMFDPDDLAAAWAELEARYDAGEAAPHARTRAALERVNRGVAARDWEQLASAFAPDFAVEDHRPLGTLSALSRGEWVASVRALAELRPDAALRLDHVLGLDDRRAFTVGTWVGGEAGGAFEIQVVVVAKIGFEGIRRWYTYDLDQLDAARACFDAIGADAPRDPLAALAKPNAASAALDRLQARFEARDWTGVRALAAPGARFEDRRRHAQVSGDVDWWLADLRQIAGSEVGELRYSRRLVATAGDRIRVERVLWTGGPAGGGIEIEYLWLAEVDADGRLIAGVVFDLDDRRAASREAVARWLARDAAAGSVVGPSFELIEGLNDRDAARMRAVLADDIVLHDRRRTGVGLIEGADAYVASLAALWRLAREVHWNPVSQLALERHGWVGIMETSGTLPEGGAFERSYAYVLTVAGDRIDRIEMFETEDLDTALARFAELRPDPLQVPPNAATRTRDRQQQAREAGDWDAFAALLAPDMVFDDRRRGVRLTGDRDTFLASARTVGNARTSRTLLATAGDRLALDRAHWHGAREGDFELELLTLWEVDAEGRLAAMVVFDPDDRRAAQRELLERRARSEAGRAIPEAVLELQRALMDRDLERCRAALPADFVVHDHRHSRLWTLEGADAWIAWMATLFEQSPDVILAPLYDLASEEHGGLTLAYTSGALPDGGEFEQVFVSLWHHPGGRFVGLEMFEVEDLERARARFEELRPGPGE